MARIVDTVEAMTRDVAERPLAGPWEGYDTTATDLVTMRAAIGPLVERRGMVLRDRGDIERAVAYLTRHLGL